MDQDIIINKLRHLINHLPFMSAETMGEQVRIANEMLDKYFRNGGKFIEMDPQQASRPDREQVAITARSRRGEEVA